MRLSRSPSRVSTTNSKGASDGLGAETTRAPLRSRASRIFATIGPLPETRYRCKPPPIARHLLEALPRTLFRFPDAPRDRQQDAGTAPARAELAPPPESADDASAAASALSFAPAPR